MKLGDNQKMPYPHSGRSIKTYSQTTMMPLVSQSVQSGLGGVGLRLGGGGGQWWWTPTPPSSPPSPSLTPPPPMFPHISSSCPPAYPTSYIRAHSAGRKWRGDTHMPLTTREVSQSWRPRKRARPKGGSRATMRPRDPKGTSWDPSASRQATRMGLAFVALTTTSTT